LGELGLGGRIILKWILKKLSVKMWTEFNWLSVGFGGCYARENDLLKKETLYSAAVYSG
jgi:hypothetical protein